MSEGSEIDQESVTWRMQRAIGGDLRWLEFTSLPGSVFQVWGSKAGEPDTLLASAMANAAGVGVIPVFNLPPDTRVWIRALMPYTDQ